MPTASSTIATRRKPVNNRLSQVTDEHRLFSYSTSRSRMDTDQHWISSKVSNRSKSNASWKIKHWPLKRKCGGGATELAWKNYLLASKNSRMSQQWWPQSFLRRLRWNVHQVFLLKLERSQPWLTWLFRNPYVISLYYRRRKNRQRNACSPILRIYPVCWAYGSIQCHSDYTY